MHGETVKFTKRCYMTTGDSMVILNSSFTHIYCKCLKLIHVQFTFRLDIVRKVKGKDKVVLVHAMKARGDLGYSSTNSERRRSTK